MLAGRAQENKYLEACFQKSGSQVIVFYGCENIGKTSLLLDFCQDKSCAYYQARACSESEQLQLWADEIREDYPNVRIRAEFSSVFRALVSGDARKQILVIDEFQHIVKSSEHFMEEIIYLTHHMPEGKSVLVVLCSSATGWVENSMVSRIGTAAYEITGFFKMKELGFLDLVRYFPGYSVEQCVELYAVLGGVPGLWSHFDPKRSVEENICREILKQDTFLHQEAARCISKELREAAVYQTLLETIGAGYSKLNDIYQNTGYSRAKISVYLKNLMELEIVEKVFSVDTAGKDRAQCGLYRIKNQFVYFWFHFVFPNLSKLSLMSEEKFYKKYIARDFRSFTASSFVKVCTEYLELLNQMGRLKPRFQQIGCWVGKTGTIDLLTEGEGEDRIAGICNWEKNTMTCADYEKLLQCIHQAKIQVADCYLFTIGDFEKPLVQLAKQQSQLHLINLSQL